MANYKSRKNMKNRIKLTICTKMKIKKNENGKNKNKENLRGK